MTEKQLSDKIIKALRQMGAFAVKIHGGTFQARGLPYIVGCWRGMFFGLEVKLPGKENTITKLQQKKLQDIEDAGGTAEMVTTVDQALKAVKRGYKNWKSI